MSLPDAAARPPAGRSFVRRYHSEILAECGVRPDLLDEIAEIAEEIAAASDAVPPSIEAAGRHALDRLAQELDITRVVRELSQLRSAAITVLARVAPDFDLAELRAFDLAIDHALSIAIARHVESEAKDRALAKLESLLLASPAGIAFLDRDLRYLRINQAMAAINGVPVEQHIGRTVGEVLPAVASTIVPMLRHVIDTGQPIRNLEIAETAVDDAALARTFLLNYFPVPDASGAIVGVGGIILDVTDAKRMHQELYNEQLRIQSIIDHSPAAIWVKDATGKIVLANRMLAEALGHPDSTVVGQKSADILGVEAAMQHDAHDRVVLAEKRAIQVEESVPSPTGTRTFLSIKFPIPGTPPLIGGIATDITDRKRIEEALQNAVRLRDDLLAIVSHDLRSPLGAVQLGASMILGQVGNDPRARKHLEMIQRAVSRMENLIDDLMDSANIRVGRLQLDLHAEQAVSILDEALDMHQSLAEEKGLRLERHNSLGDLQVRCDRDRILQVLGNLLGNALKFCRAGDTIRVRGTPEHDCIRFDVSDTGPGIDPAIQSKLFEPYWSGAQRTTGGAGLGLYISKGIIEGHGGRLWVESVPGHGATFSFTLPIAR